LESAARRAALESKSNWFLAFLNLQFAIRNSQFAMLPRTHPRSVTMSLELAQRTQRPVLRITDAATAVRSPVAQPWWHYANPLHSIITLLRHRSLIRQFTIREIRGRYQGSFLGMLWSFLTPVGMLLAYTFVFRYVLHAKWGVSPDESGLEFSLTLFTGLLIFNLCAESMTRAPALILSHPNFVKKVVFPLEILPVTAVLSSLVHILASLLIVVIVSASVTGRLGWQALWFPAIVLPYLCFVIGVGWFLASLGVFLRDLGPTVAVGMQLLVFLTPVFYPLEKVPEWLRMVMQLNPLAVVVENGRRVLLWDTPPSLLALMAMTVLSLLVFQAGYVWFMKSKRAFADVV
jgi:homopolymeric O-antigen transport system permease protein